jgi:hypothetical protein
LLLPIQVSSNRALLALDVELARNVPSGCIFAG